MPLTKIHQFELELLEPCIAMSARGVRVDELVRRRMVAELEALREPQLQTLRKRLTSKLESFKDLPRRSLFINRWTCPCCRNGKGKREACWSCAGFTKKPGKKQLGERELTTCAVCNGEGQRDIWTVNPDSTEQRKVILYTLLKLPKRVKQGKLRTDEAALKELVGLDETGTVASMLEIRKATTMRSILERIAPGPDGRIRSFYNPAGTETGRFSSAESFLARSTNLQNLPKRMAKLDPRFDVRRCLVPDEGCSLIEADLSGAEAWITAALSGDERLLDMLRAGINVHQWTAAQIFGGKPEDIEKGSFEYIIGKETRHSGNYGRGPKTLMKRINFMSDQTGFSIDLVTAERADYVYHTLHPTLRQWWQRVHNQLQKSKYIETCFGRRRTFFGRNAYEWLGETHREAIAFDPQATVADLLNRGLLRWWRQHDGKVGELLLQVHDSIIVQAPTFREETVGTLLINCLAERITVNGYTFTIPVDVSCSNESWAQVA